MYKIILPLLAVIIAISSCTKNVENSCPPITVVAPDSQVAALQQYIDTNHIAAVKDEHGFFYSIKDTGVGASANTCSIVTVNYSGKLLNGTQFDYNHDKALLLRQLINGWQEAIPLIRKGGHITLYLPPALAYGAASTTTIPSNSNLIFEIELLDVK